MSDPFNDLGGVIHELSENNVIKEKHEKRFMIGLGVLDLIYQLFTFWKKKNDE